MVWEGMGSSQRRETWNKLKSLQQNLGQRTLTAIGIPGHVCSNYDSHNGNICMPNIRPEWGPDWSWMGSWLHHHSQQHGELELVLLPQREGSGAAGAPPFQGTGHLPVTSPQGRHEGGPRGGWSGTVKAVGEPWHPKLTEIKLYINTSSGIPVSLGVRLLTTFDSRLRLSYHCFGSASQVISDLDHNLLKTLAAELLVAKIYLL